MDNDDLRPNSLSLTKPHQLLLQVLWAKKTITSTELETTFQRIVEKYRVPGSPNLDRYIKTINDAMKSISFRIYKDKFDNVVVYSIINDVKDEVIKLNSQLTQLELDVFNFMLEQPENNTRFADLPGLIRKSVPSIKASTSTTIMSDIEFSVKNLIEQEFLYIEDGSHNVKLANRARLELRGDFDAARNNL